MTSKVNGKTEILTPCNLKCIKIFKNIQYPLSPSHQPLQPCQCSWKSVLRGLLPKYVKCKPHVTVCLSFPFFLLPTAISGMQSQRKPCKAAVKYYPYTTFRAKDSTWCRVITKLYFTIFAAFNNNNNNNNLIYIAPACRMTSEALADSSSRATECLTEK